MGEFVDDGTGGLTRRIIGAAIRVHRHLGPGLLEKPYVDCFEVELQHEEIPVERQVRLPLIYRNVRIEDAYRMDLWVARTVVVEIKVVTKLLPVHMAQLQTYLRLSGSPVGLLFNFNTEILAAGGFKRIFRARAPAGGRAMIDSRA